MEAQASSDHFKENRWEGRNVFTINILLLLLVLLSPTFSRKEKTPHFRELRDDMYTKQYLE